MPAPLPSPRMSANVPAPCLLIVEDSAMLLELLVILCAQHGVATLTASSGEAALALLRQHGRRIDWLLTDIRLPGAVDGWAVAEVYRQIRPHRPVIYASTAATLTHPAVPGRTVVTKPFAIADLLRLMRMMASERDVPGVAASAEVGGTVTGSQESA